MTRDVVPGDVLVTTKFAYLWTEPSVKEHIRVSVQEGTLALTLATFNDDGDVWLLVLLDNGAVGWKPENYFEALR